MIRKPFLPIAASLAMAVLDCPVTGAAETIQVSIDGQARQGKILARSTSRAYMLGRDGRLWDFPLNHTVREVTPTFRSYSAPRMRGELQREFGPSFEVSGTGHYLVVHPAGTRDQWAQRFEALYRSYLLYFNVRKTRPEPLKFPLVAVVFPDKAQFYSYAVRDNARLGANVLGYYSPTSNRIALYDYTAENPRAPWTVNAETIIHETTHQLAYNTGLHNRFAESPRWVVEGLGTMFEAPGVWNSRAQRSLASRVNQYRYQDFLRYQPKRRQGSLAEFVTSDRAFSADIGAAYAEAWALTFFLCETHHQKYLAYLTRVASRPSFSRYSGPERLRDFTAVFGDNLALLEAHYLRFMKKLKV